MQIVKKVHIYKAIYIKFKMFIYLNKKFTGQCSVAFEKQTEFVNLFFQYFELFFYLTSNLKVLHIGRFFDFKIPFVSFHYLSPL